jgi:hypothetical protein
MGARERHRWRDEGGRLTDGELGRCGRGAMAQQCRWKGTRTVTWPGSLGRTAAQGGARVWHHLGEVGSSSAGA